jgi:hypothetical protein
MPPKSLGLKTKPGAQAAESSLADDWVQNRQGTSLPVNHDKDEQEDKEAVKKKRITFEVSELEHQKIKVLAAQKGMTIKELMQKLLQRELSS